MPPASGYAYGQQPYSNAPPPYRASVPPVPPPENSQATGIAIGVVAVVLFVVLGVVLFAAVLIGAFLLYAKAGLF